LEYLVMDLKCGNGAFMQSFADAKALAQSIIEVANGAGTRTCAIITDMNQVLGTTAGNAVEVNEALEYLQNKNINPRLDAVTKALCAELLVACGHCADKDAAARLIDTVLTSGKALEKFAQMVAALGGPTDFVEHSSRYLPQAAHTKPIYAEKSGYVSAMDARAVGLSIIELGGGRSIPTQKLDLATGYTNFAQIGDYVDASAPLALVHYQDEAQFARAQKYLLEAIKISDTPVEKNNPIILTLA
jgi:thymidine phosphorylase